MLAIWSLVPLPFLNPVCTSGCSWFTYCRSPAWRILSITLLTCESKLRSCVRLCNPMDCSPWNSTGQSIGVGSLSLLQGIFPIQGSKPGLLHCRQILYQPSHEGSPASMWNECNCVVVWTFFGIALLWGWKENWPFPVLWPLLSFPSLEIITKIKLYPGINAMRGMAARGKIYWHE